MEASINGTFDKPDFDKLGRPTARILAAAKATVWCQHIETQRGSGQSIRAWCRANNVREHCFYFWRIRLGLSPVKRRRFSQPPDFAQVIVNSPAAEAKPAAIESIRLRLIGERELILPASMPLEQVAQLIHALEAKPSGMEAKP